MAQRRWGKASMVGVAATAALIVASIPAHAEWDEKEIPPHSYSVNSPVYMVSPIDNEGTVNLPAPHMPVLEGIDRINGTDPFDATGIPISHDANLSELSGKNADQRVDELFDRIPLPIEEPAPERSEPRLSEASSAQQNDVDADGASDSDLAGDPIYQILRILDHLQS